MLQPNALLSLRRKDGTSPRTGNRIKVGVKNVKFSFRRNRQNEAESLLYMQQFVHKVRIIFNELTQISMTPFDSRVIKSESYREGTATHSRTLA